MGSASCPPERRGRGTPRPPRPDGNRYREQYGVIVICSNEDHQRDVYERLRNEGHKVRVVTT